MQSKNKNNSDKSIYEQDKQFLKIEIEQLNNKISEIKKES